MKELSGLVDLAKKATSGEWNAFISTGGDGTFSIHTSDDSRKGDVVNWPGFDTANCSKAQKKANAKYIAAANPATILAIAEAFRALEKQRDALAAENDILKSGIGFFSYGTDSGFEEHDSAEKAIAAADSDIDYYRGDACDGWSEETDCTVWGVILQRATMSGLRTVTEEDNFGSGITEWCDYTLLPSIETPATDAYLNSVRAEGAEMVKAHPAISLCSLTHVCVEIAAQLRAGKARE